MMMMMMMMMMNKQNSMIARNFPIKKSFWIDDQLCFDAKKSSFSDKQMDNGVPFRLNFGSLGDPNIFLVT